MKNNNFTLKYGDLSDTSNLSHIICDIDMEILEIYNLAAMSHVKVSFKIPEYTIDVDGIGVLRLLEAIRMSGLENRIRFYPRSTL